MTRPAADRTKASRGRSSWPALAGSILVHLLLLWWLTGTLEAGGPQVQTPFVVDLVAGTAPQDVDVRSGEGDAGEEPGAGEAPVPQAPQPEPREEPAVESPAVQESEPPARAGEETIPEEEADPQTLTGEEEIPPAEDDVLPERREEVLAAYERELLARNQPRVDVPDGDRQAPGGGGGGAPGALGSAAGITGPLGQRRLVHMELPEYPAWARRQGIEAGVRFRFWVSPDGHVIRVETIQRSGYPELESLGRDALMHWKFASLPHGQFQEEWGEVPILWRLSETGRGGVMTQEEP
ncbi:MAG: TonB family protein [Candidatus Eisenbacteria bacterium]|nr:TonB family protein [Candidatus Eisenbacteria bacterium]